MTLVENGALQISPLEQIWYCRNEIRDKALRFLGHEVVSSVLFVAALTTSDINILIQTVQCGRVLSEPGENNPSFEPPHGVARMLKKVPHPSQTIGNEDMIAE
jgi:hypothetical protein